MSTSNPPVEQVCKYRCPACGYEGDGETLSKAGFTAVEDATTLTLACPDCDANLSLPE